MRGLPGEGKASQKDLAGAVVRAHLLRRRARSPGRASNSMRAEQASSPLSSMPADAHWFSKSTSRLPASPASSSPAITLT